MAKIKIDREKCVSCGACTTWCPDCFSMDANDKIAVSEKKIDKKLLKEAVDNCPVQAISAKL